MELLEAKSQQTQKTWKPTVAGILDIISGAYVGCFILARLLFLFFGTLAAALQYNDPETSWFLIPLLIFGSAVMASIILFLSAATILALVGGVFAIRRKAWILALVGSIFASLSPLSGPYLNRVTNEQLFSSAWILVTLLGLTAIYLTVLSKKEFE